jgi:broad specificity phosphatase PhoE
MRRSPALLLALFAALAGPGPALAQKAVIVVRHADNAGDKLTEAGQARAQRLVTALGKANVAAVYSTDAKRTVGTVTPFAESRKLPVRFYDTAKGDGFDARPFAARLRKEHPGDVVLVVGHVTTIPDLLKSLGCPDDVTLAPLEYDDLFVVVPKEGAGAALVRITY